MKIFYSWQSDIKGHRGLIESAIKLCIKSMDGFELETASRDVIGSKDLSLAILKKIESSDLMIADVTTINPRGTRPTPNPNVLFEAGYGMHALGEDKVILIADSRYSKNNLPFDIRNRIMVLRDYSRKPELKAEIGDVIRSVAESAVASNPQAVLVTVIENLHWLDFKDYGFRGFSTDISVDNFHGDQNYIQKVYVSGTSSDGTAYKTDVFSKDFMSQENLPIKLPAKELVRLHLYLMQYPSPNKSQPDLDRDTIELVIELRTNDIIRLPVKLT